MDLKTSNLAESSRLLDFITSAAVSPAFFPLALEEVDSAGTGAGLTAPFTFDCCAAATLSGSSVKRINIKVVFEVLGR